MPKFTIERIVSTIYRQDISAKNVESALKKAKGNRGSWDLDSQREEFEVSPEEPDHRIGFGR